MSAQENTETSAQAATMVIGASLDRPLSYMSTLSKDERDAERTKFFEPDCIEGPSDYPSTSVSADFLARMKNDLDRKDLQDFMDLARQVSAANQITSTVPDSGAQGDSSV